MHRSPLLFALTLASCGGGGDAVVADLKDPETCRPCHPVHYQDWLSSTHAFSDRSPIFRAFETRGMRETSGALGSLCVKCHAPMALREGLTTNGLDLDAVPSRFRGVTCYACHAMVEPSGFVLADDGVMRGGIGDPIHSAVHRSQYSALLDRNTTFASAQCSRCHDASFIEWKTSLYSNRDQPAQYLSCGRCHMPGHEQAVAAVEGAPARLYHDHKMPGTDVAMGDWVGKDPQLQAIHDDLDGSVSARLCVTLSPGVTRMQVTLDNAYNGHRFPTGVPRQRAVWVELVAYDAAGQIIYESGNVPDGTPAVSVDGWVIRERYQDAAGNDLLMPWATGGTTLNNLLEPAVTNDPKDPRYVHSRTHDYGAVGEADRITVRVRLRPTDFDVMQSLVDSGDMDRGALSQMPTLTLAGTVIEWKRSAGKSCVPQ